MGDKTQSLRNSQIKFHAFEKSDDIKPIKDSLSIFRIDPAHIVIGFFELLYEH